MADATRIEVSGYDMVAMARRESDGRELVVLNNNCDHYLLAARLAGAGDAEVLADFPYGTGEGDDACAYQEALETMARKAVRLPSDLIKEIRAYLNAFGVVDLGVRATDRPGRPISVSVPPQRIGVAYNALRVAVFSVPIRVERMPGHLFVYRA